MHDFDVEVSQHHLIISEATLWVSEATLWVIECWNMWHFGYNDNMSFYTSKGDDGTTSLLGEGRVAKYHARIEAVGTLDESSTALGLARAQCLDPRSSPILLEAQRDLYKLMA